MARQLLIGGALMALLGWQWAPLARMVYGHFFLNRCWRPLKPVCGII